MRSRSTFAFACLISVASLAIAATSKSVHVPAGNLIDGLEYLARQYGVDLIYPSEQLEGRRTRGLHDKLEPVDAFKKLLEGTPLVVSEEDGALLITQAANASPPATAQESEDSLPEVRIQACRERLSALRVQIEKIEDQFYADYNRLNDISAYDVRCSSRMQGFFRVRYCHPAFLDYVEPGLGSDDSPAYKGVGNPFAAQLRLRDYQKHMVALVSQHPELLTVLQERNELAQRYEDARQQKLKGKVFNWD